VNGAAVSQSITFTPVSQVSSAVYSDVNATSSNILSYSLPGAEEFTVGSSSATVNYISLYLSGSGSVYVGIGTSLFSNSIFNTTVTVTSSKHWYNISIPSGISLSGSTDYYLNVFQASGSVQWGYTTSPSVAKNNLQDYYYVGTTLSHDDISPNIYTIGYYSTSPPAASSISLSQPSLFPAIFVQAITAFSIIGIYTTRRFL
jgi:hypothetical protein